MTIVVAGKYYEFLDWCKDQGVSPNSRDIVYATVTSIRGLQLSKDDKIVKIGTYYYNRDFNQLVDMLYVLDKTRKS